ncbi:hypothetical protein SAMN05192561_12820 [Halopenitus malekzadehii]|jgi:hypothetical protein|uniref:Uncharacterized protein n=2 Tax=Halopenitus malekzadehii TaxID=1267564 RepID=A0A1H6K7H7_9EURY|nr:hypothetical protein SAMN05192561_12820 [Halopenitus malekzadehii]
MRGQDMDDAALLRQTIRRCTAILVATITITGVSLQRASEAGLLILIATGTIVYLVNEFFIEAPTVDDSDDRLEGE